MTKKVAVLKFPGTTCEGDVEKALREAGGNPQVVRHDSFDPDKFDAVVLPGGFSYGDYLVAGAIAASGDSMRKVKEMAEEGKIVLGICNGFQILVWSGLLKGALLENLNRRFVSKWVYVKVVNDSTAITKGLKGKVLRLPIAHAEGRYYHKDVSEVSPVLVYSSQEGKVSDEYNPNGSLQNIASVSNEAGNVIGMMPHPERASFKNISPFGEPDGLYLLRGVVN
ncbi:phosphoribosylformylglycinamidine synthase I [Sulfuracidifex tepidarius]|uniref:Phosphoribosylformylglycinamidine synthase subunit PurQ n=1 Tax=Sulfuracidifex tepidarius TaxID=1294262 RepID=A0A510E2S1_9CREN|nr:phosphoribosylformylglycinamidine synthase I [Sulfuracidifex tepidarius]BBG24049.1 Intracellular protease 1 [Sulfuracidifex tepidarius]BBG26804.1 Intracellular protease 1 [Sulfuracidifex tepidarius]